MRKPPLLATHGGLVLEQHGKPFAMLKAACFGLCVELLEGGGHAMKAEFAQHVDGRMDEHWCVSSMEVIRATQIGVIDDGGRFGGMPCGLVIGDKRSDALAVQPTDLDAG